MNPVTAQRRHFEDLVLGETIALGPLTVDRDQIIAFAREFDPFPFHLDEAAAKRSLLGGLAASGWQTAGLTLRLFVDAFLSTVDSLGGLGFTDLKWAKPLMVGDSLSGTATLTRLRRSDSHPERGIVTIGFEMRNQRGQTVMTMSLVNMVGLRSPEAAPGSSS